MPRPFDLRADQTLTMLRESGQYKHLRVLTSPMDAEVEIEGFGRCVCFCSNNYLGLANHSEVVEAGVRALKDYGAGTASVRFICGTFSPHLELERAIARYMGTESSYTFVSAWTANEAVFPTLCEPGDIIISDELNHACIIDSIRLATVIKKGLHKAVYKNNTLEGPGSLREALEKAKANPEVKGQIWVVTDGVFSMEGSIGDLKAMRRMCDEYNAMLVVDDSHGHGVMGTLGRGTHEHFGMIDALATGSGTATLRVANQPRQTAHAHAERGGTQDRVDIFTGTLGKALGGGAGGFVAGSKQVCDLLVQRGRPTLFSNALPVTIACSAMKAIEVLLREPKRVQTLRDNVAYARARIKDAGFEVLQSPTAICPIIVHDTAKAIAMSKRLLEMGVFVIGFGYPVVPEGHARLRVQISAAHSRTHIDRLVDALRKL
ncbi:MAG: aminotransferase class I/II-fold pyridoxal phosphate-dependent enzyme [Phycisphaerales bacterium]|nr:aminotransferase class I/II-fold pyridoxal phosphate-dependent enzyme [Phycisphaerales bacterium]